MLSRVDFDFLIAQVVHLVNRRPIAFKEGLRNDSVSLDIPSPITPEILLHGRELVSVNIIPCLQPNSEPDEWLPGDNVVKHIQNSCNKLLKARGFLTKIYHEEFLSKLITQSTNSSNTFKPVNHNKVGVGDLVVLKEQFTKPTNYPMAIVTNITKNDIGEVTAIKAKKGSTGESVFRHVESVIPLLSRSEYAESSGEKTSSESQSKGEVFSASEHARSRPVRNASLKAANIIQQQAAQGLT